MWWWWLSRAGAVIEPALWLHGSMAGHCLPFGSTIRRSHGYTILWYHTIVPWYLSIHLWMALPSTICHLVGVVFRFGIGIRVKWFAEGGRGGNWWIEGTHLKTRQEFPTRLFRFWGPLRTRLVIMFDLRWSCVLCWFFGLISLGAFKFQQHLN